MKCIDYNLKLCPNCKGNMPQGLCWLEDFFNDIDAFHNADTLKDLYIKLVRVNNYDSSY
jgi:hypothetical protein